MTDGSAGPLGVHPARLLFLAAAIVFFAGIGGLMASANSIGLVLIGSAIAAVAAAALLPGGWRSLRSIHPGIILAGLDLLGLTIASYLTYAETFTPSRTPTCRLFHGCEAVAHSVYSRPFFGIPVAVYGIALSLTLFVLAIWWWRTGNYKLLLAHYALSLVGVLFEGWFQFAQVFLVKSVCVWCESYGVSLILRFIIALWVYLRTPNPADAAVEEPS